MRKFALILATLLAACGDVKEAEAPSPAPETERTLAAGRIVGFQTANGALAWRAIPYAAPPVGTLRWRAPRPAAGWEGVRSATRTGDPCPQITNSLDHPGLEPGALIGDEDCLTLDVYAPANAERPLPVMLWVHGGGNAAGRASAFDGSALAQNENVIVVVAQYRLGPLGWFAHPALRASAETDEDRAANFGVLDIIASLRWVQDNIAAFGGDPSRVTAFGTSAGGHDVATLLVSPLAKGLFHRAIIQSGNFGIGSLEDAERADGGAPNPSLAIAAKLGVDTAADLRALSTDSLFAAYELDRYGHLRLPSPIADGVVLPSEPMDGTSYASAGTFNAVPILTGVNRDEAKLAQYFNPQFVERRFGLFTVPRDPAFYEARAEYLSRLWRIRAVDAPAEAMTAAGHPNVFAYRFDWDDGGRRVLTDTAALLGAAHGLETPFVFARFHLFGEAIDPVLFERGTAQDRQALAAAMGAYWAEFARNGAPGDGGRGLPVWPRWEQGGALMRLDSPAGGGPEVIVGAESPSTVLADLRTDGRLDEEDRCRLLREIAPRIPDAAAEIATFACPAD